MQTWWRVELLGGLRAIRGEQILTHFETRKAALLLAFLAYDSRHAHSREALAEQLWPDEGLEATRDRLRQALAALRRALEPPDVPAGSVLIADRIGVQIAPQAITTDVAEFEAALAIDSRKDDGIGLSSAVALYAGDLLPGYHEPWILTERRQLADKYRKALARLASLSARSGDYIQAIEYARRAVDADPLQEEAHVELIRLYAAAGRTSDMLRQYHEMERLLREELNTAPSASTQSLLAQLRAGMPRLPAEPLSASNSTSPSPAKAREEGRGKREEEDNPKSDSSFILHPSSFQELEPEGGAVPLESAFYIQRPADAEFNTALLRHDSIVLVKGARQIGKTSLLARGLQQARQHGARVVLTDLQKFTAEQMATADALFRTVAETMIEQLELEAEIEAVWKQGRGWNVNFERFLRREVLGKLAAPLVWGLDEADRLFRYQFSAEIFGLFRSWHNERSLDPSGPWSRLTLAIAYATEAHLFITDLNQSPFNVGTRLTLEDFSADEVRELNRRYGSPLRDEHELARYIGLVGGHPYLVRRGMHVMATERLTVADFEARAERENGVYSDHLNRLLNALNVDTFLCEAVRALLRGEPCPTSAGFYRLRSAGVIVGESAQEARLRCRLYQQFLSGRMRDGD